MVQINLPDNYLLLSDSNQWIIAKVESGRVNNLSYHTTIISALESYISLKIRQSEAKSIHELILYQKTLLTAVHKALQPLNILSEIKNLSLKEESLK